MTMLGMPTYDQMFQPIISVFRELGESASLIELTEKTAQEMKVSENILNEPHIRFRGTDHEVLGSSSEFAYRLRWALTYLKKAGMVTNSSRGVWALTEVGSEATVLNSKSIILAAGEKSAVLTDDPNLESELDPVDEQNSDDYRSWQDLILEILLALTPQAFERLAQRILREAGFKEVIVTGKSGDGGIDGRGILQLNNLLNFSAVFQCKRYQNTVGPAEIREFRGALIGRADRGIFMTTSRFTTSAVAEANRDGVTPIDLVDGERLINLMKQFSLGIEVRMVESVNVDVDWFKSLG